MNFSRMMILTAITAWLPLIIGCSSHPPLESLDEEGSFRELANRYEEGDYVSAVDGLNFFTLNYSGSAKVDSAQFLLGLSQYKMKEYLVAANSFEELTNRFPSSPLVADAMFKIGECYWKISPKYMLDQEYTDKAVTALQTFIEYYPDRKDQVKEAEDLIAGCREKLAHKQYASGIIYLKMQDYTAAAIYFKGVVDDYYDTDWKPRAQYQLGVAQLDDQRYNDAAQSFRAFLNDNPGHEWAGNARTGLAQAIRLAAELTAQK